MDAVVEFPSPWHEVKLYFEILIQPSLDFTFFLLQVQAPFLCFDGGVAQPHHVYLWICQDYQI
jgi:hypothetical protein